MPFFRINGMRMHIKWAGKKRDRPKPCCAQVEADGQRIRCEAIAGILCDWPLEDGGTCDAPLCSDHAVTVGTDKHYCPIHAKRAAEQEPQQSLL